MACSIVMYYVVMRLLQPASPVDNPHLVTVLTVGSLALVGASFLVKRRFSARARETGAPGPRRAGQLVALACCDTAALFGLISWFVTGSPLSYYPVVIGLGGLLMHYPAAARG